MIRRIKGITRGQRGFTLIELLAVMAILATLVAIVAPAVAGTREASVQAQAQQDGTQVRTAANKYFSSINVSETRTTHTVTTTTMVPDAVVGTTPKVSQVVSNRWPEKYITLDAAADTTTDAGKIGALYTDVFNTVAYVPAGIAKKNVKSVTLLATDATTGLTITIPAATFFKAYTAVDFGSATVGNAEYGKGIVGKGFLAKPPAGLTAVSEGKPNFLWLLSKASSSAERTDDSRDVAVFKLVKVEKTEGSMDTAQDYLSLTYDLILGSAPTPP